MPDIETANEEQRRRRILSLIADGEADSDAAAAGFQSWRDDDATRATWHAYQLIGDVMRSEDLARPAEADSAFLQALRVRLAAEPVVLAPQPEPDERLPAPRERSVAGLRGRRSPGAMAWARGHWQAPAAMAAGFLIVAGGFATLGPRSANGPQVAVLSGAPAATPAAQVAQVAQVAPVSATGPAVMAPAASAALAERAQLAPYLAAHRQSTMNRAFQMPDVGVRQASFEQPAP